MNLLPKSPRIILCIVLPLALALLTTACGKRETKSGKKIVAYVNEAPIYAEELEKSITLKTRLEPGFKRSPETEKDQLELIIEKRLLIQEAVEKGLAREDKFVDTIQTFWEQTLIRDFIDFKKKEFSSALAVTEQEIRDYYERLGKRVTFKVLKSRDKGVIDKAYDEVTKKGESSDVKEFDVIGPIGYDDISSNVLRQAFDLPLGGVIREKDQSYYYLVTVADKQTVMLEPLEALRPQITKRVVAMKERQLFERWFQKKRASAKIDIIQK